MIDMMSIMKVIVVQMATSACVGEYTGIAKPPKFTVVNLA
jgi:hypothetical protein